MGFPTPMHTYKLETSNLVHSFSFVFGKPSERINNFSQKGRGLSHVTPIIFGIRSNISSKKLQLETSNLVRTFVLGKPSRRINNFPQIWRGSGHVTPKMFGIRLIISSKLLELGTSNLVRSFVLRKPNGRINNFPPKGRGLGHVTLHFWQTIRNIFKTI